MLLVSERDPDSDELQLQAPADRCRIEHGLDGLPAISAERHRSRAFSPVLIASLSTGKSTEALCIAAVECVDYA